MAAKNMYSRQGVVGPFIDDLRYLSNFWELENGIVFENMMYRSVENAFQAAKTLDRNERRAFQLITPAQAKKAGRSITLRPDWLDVREGIMYALLLDKFAKHPELRRQLLDTGNKPIVEFNYWHDNYWGECLCLACQHKPKINKLGFLLRRVRTHLSTAVQQMGTSSCRVCGIGVSTKDPSQDACCPNCGGTDPIAYAG